MADNVKETRQFDESKYRSMIVTELKKKKGKSTLSDVVVATGLPTEWVNYTLQKMILDYKGHIAATEEGELIYDFDPKFRKRVGGLEKLKNMGKALVNGAWKVFTFLFKIWIVVTLIGYFVIFILLLLGLLFLQLKGGGKGRRKKGGFLPIGSILRMFLIWDLFSDDRRRSRRRDYTYSALKQKKKKKDRNLYEKVFAFVFGEKTPEEDPLKQEKETLAFIRQNNGRLVASDLIALHSYSFDEAEQEAVRLVANYNGDVEATEEGNVIYTFDKLMVSARKERDYRQYSHCWEEMEPKEKFNKNSTTFNWVIGLMNGFNLFMGIFVINGFLQTLYLRTQMPLFQSPTTEFVLGPIPIVFSFLFFLVPAARSIVISKKNKAIVYRNKIRNMIRAVFNKIGERLHIYEVQNILNYIQKTPKKEAESFAKDFVVRYQGDLDSDEKGIYYTFPRISQEQTEIKQIRQHVDPSQYKLGDVEFSSE